MLFYLFGKWMALNKCDHRGDDFIHSTIIINSNCSMFCCLKCMQGIQTQKWSCESRCGWLPKLEHNLWKKNKLEMFFLIGKISEKLGVTGNYRAEWRLMEPDQWPDQVPSFSQQVVSFGTVSLFALSGLLLHFYEWTGIIAVCFTNAISLQCLILIVSFQHVVFVLMGDILYLHLSFFFPVTSQTYMTDSFRKH